ncbi:MAG: glycosyltransferase family 4 protein [Promethearchaeota archaeon]
MEIKTFIGRKLNYINGIMRRQIEIDKYLKDIDDITLSYEYYEGPGNPIDFLSKRYVLYPYTAYRSAKNLKDNIIFHVAFQNIADIALFLDRERTFITCYDIFNFLEKGTIRNSIFAQRYAFLGLKRCMHIISISDFTKNELISKFNIPKERIFVIKCGINHEIFNPIPKNKLIDIKPLFPNYKKILHVGTEVQRKDILTLYKAFYLIKKKIHKIKLIRVGPSNHKKLIKALGLEKDIIYINNISSKRLNEIYNLCDLFIFPSIYEGFGFPGLEAAACGTPVICSDIPIFREIYQNFPLFFQPQNHKILAKLILDNIDNENLKQEMINKGIDISNQYSWKKSAEKYHKYVKYILDNNA